MQTTAFQATSQTGAAELTDFHTRFAFGGDAFGCAVAASSYVKLLRAVGIDNGVVSLEPTTALDRGKGRWHRKRLF